MLVFGQCVHGRFIFTDPGSGDRLHRANDRFDVCRSIDFTPQTDLSIAHGAFWKGASDWRASFKTASRSASSSLLSEPKRSLTSDAICVEVAHSARSASRI